MLSDVLSSQRADIYALVPQGKALGTDFDMAETYPKASSAFAFAALPAGTDPAATNAELEEDLAELRGEWSTDRLGLCR